MLKLNCQVDTLQELFALPNEQAIERTTAESNNTTRNQVQFSVWNLFRQQENVNYMTALFVKRLTQTYLNHMENAQLYARSPYMRPAHNYCIYIHDCMYISVYMNEGGTCTQR